MVGFLVALWSANSGITALFDALNVVYGEREKRGLLKFYVISLLFTVGMIGFVIAAIGAVVVAPLVLTFMGFVTPAEQLLAILRWPVLLVVGFAWLTVLYRYGPSRQDAKWRWVAWGSATAGDPLARGVDAVFLVRRQLRQLQQDLWLTRRRRRLHDLDLAVSGNCPARGRTQCRNGAPDGGG